MMKKTSAEWYEEDSWIIVDPDGWDRGNYQYSFYGEKITQEEYFKRRDNSTCLMVPK